MKIEDIVLDDNTLKKRREVVEIPQVFICPISLEPMQDPVTLCTGQTYERCNILRWFSTGGYICPTTMQELWDVSLTPNTTLRKLISKWYSHCILLQKIQAEELRSRVRGFVEKLKRAKGRTRVQILVALRALVQAEECARRTLVDEGGVPLVSSLLGPFTSYAVGSEAVGLLIRLPLDADAKKNLRHPARMSSLVDLLHDGLIDTRIDSATLIETILEDDNGVVGFDNVSSFRLLFGLLRLVKDRVYPRAVSAGLSLLRLVCSCKPARTLVVGTGTVAHLVELLSFTNTTTGITIESSMGILEMLSTLPEGRKALKDCDSTIRNVVGVLMRVSENCTHHALAVLLAVCRTAPEVCAPVAVEAGLAAKLLLVIQSACDPVLKQRASELLKLCSLNYRATIFVSKCELAHTIQ